MDLPEVFLMLRKGNILFDEERYNAVVDCCALGPDLAVLEDGDATEIGARCVETFD
jgi:hypothetical protein